MPFYHRFQCPYDSGRLCIAPDVINGQIVCQVGHCPILDKYRETVYNNNINKNESENTNETF